MQFAICKECRMKIKYCGNTTNLRVHLTRYHLELAIANPEERPKVVLPANQRTLDQTKVIKLPQNSERAKKITEAIAYFIPKDLQPYSVVENEGFQNLLGILEPRYVIPSRKYFTDTAIPKLYSEVKEEVNGKLSLAEGVAITCDGWSSRATESYMTITAHHITDEWQLLAHVLQTRAMHESHTGANVAEVLKTATEEWGISNKPIVLVTDNASNMVVAAQVGGYLHVKCFAHTLNLASQRALKLPAVARLLGRVRRITTFFHRSTIANSMLEQKQKLLYLPTHKLKTDVVTRWNSGYEMLQRFLEQQPAICAALLSSDVRRSGSDICTLNENDITDAEDIMQALRPMFVATKIVSEEKNPTLSIIAPVHAKLLNDTHQAMGDKPIVRDIKQAINQDLQKRYSTVEEKNTLHTASALDPRFKSLPFLTTDDISATYSKLVVEAASLQVGFNELLVYYLVIILKYHKGVYK